MAIDVSEAPSGASPMFIPPPSKQKKQRAARRESSVDLSEISAMMKDVVSSVSDLRAHVSDLASRVERAESVDTGPKFVPMQSARDAEAERAVLNPDDRRGVFTGVSTDGVPRDGDYRRILTNASGEEVSGAVLARLSPRFNKGARVRINPDAIRQGSNKPWREILKTLKGNQSGEGEVRFISYLPDSGDWKYRVFVPGLTGAKRTDGFHQSELIPA